MENRKPEEITGMLADWNKGDTEALDRLMDLVYPELRRIARRNLRREGAGASIESAALANEAYLKLVRAGGIRCENRAHFLARCAQIMRRILVDHARRRRYAKRGEMHRTCPSMKCCWWRRLAASRCSPWMNRLTHSPESTTEKAA